MSRRKKKPRGNAQSRPHGGPPPLQPMYPEFSGPGETGHPLPPEPLPPPPPPAIEPVPSSEQAAPAARGRKRRRKRGGRGRRRGGSSPQQQIPATAPAPAPEIEVQAPEPEIEPIPATAPPLAPAQPRPSRGVVVLAIGLPGSGKSTWFRRRGVVPLSSDLLRTLLFDNITEQRYQDLVFSTLRSLLRARLIARMPWNYVDATNLSPNERRGWVKMAREFGYEPHAVFFDVPLEVCMERNRRRSERVVPDDVMHRMGAKLRPPTFEEGFTKITVVRVKAKEQPDRF